MKYWDYYLSLLVWMSLRQRPISVPVLLCRAHNMTSAFVIGQTFYPGH